MGVSILDSAVAEAAASISSRPRTKRELRAAPRVRSVFPASLEVHGTARQTAIVDLSAAGCALGWGEEVELGEVFALSFRLPDADGTDIHCAGLVRSVRPGVEGRVVGLEFHNLGSEQRRAVASFVRAALVGDAPGEARRHWSGVPGPGDARRVSVEEAARPVLRWAPGLADLYAEIAEHIAETEMIFVPTDDPGVGEGERLFLEIVAPSSHAVFRLLAEVVWVMDSTSGDEAGVGLRIAGLSGMDRFLLKESVRFLREDSDRYR